MKDRDSMSLRKTIVAVFAHPDDEAFGPAGTLYKYSKSHNVYLLCATKGEIGKNSGRGKNISEVRARELRKSAKILGIKKVYFLGFTDGTLSNSNYHELASKIERHLKKLKPEIVITDEHHGVSGHIDHITVSMATSYVFKRLPFINEIHYYCISREERNRFGDDYFVYFPPGYKKEDIDKVVNIEDVWEIKLAAIYSHKSQMHDIKRVLKNKGGLPQQECFIIGKR